MSFLTPDLLGALLASTSAIFTAVQGLSIRRGTETGRVGEVLFVVLLMNTLIYVPFSILFYHPNYGVNLYSGLAFVGAGVTGSLLVRIFLYSGIERVGPSRTYSIYTSSPLFATAIAVVFLGEYLTLPHLLGILLILAGVFVVAREMNVSNSKFSPGGRFSPNLLYPLAAAFFVAVNLPLSKFGLMQGTPAAVGVAIKVATALVILTACLGIRNKPLLSAFSSPNRKWYILAGVANTISLALLFAALAVSRVVVVSPLTNISPLFTLGLSYLFLSRLEVITPRLLLGATLVVGGAAAIVLLM